MKYNISVATFFLLLALAVGCGASSGSLITEVLPHGQGVLVVLSPPVLQSYDNSLRLSVGPDSFELPFSQLTLGDDASILITMNNQREAVDVLISSGSVNLTLTFEINQKLSGYNVMPVSEFDSENPALIGWLFSGTVPDERIAIRIGSKEKEKYK